MGAHKGCLKCPHMRGESVIGCPGLAERLLRCLVKQEVPAFQLLSKYHQFSRKKRAVQSQGLKRYCVYLGNGRRWIELTKRRDIPHQRIAAAFFLVPCVV